MATKRVIGRCCLCGQTARLSKEHVPPQKAFNDCDVLMKRIDQAAGPEVKFVPSGQIEQGGHRGYTLCGRCNNDTGGWYAREYVRLVKACAPHAKLANANRIIEMHLDVFPLRAMKEALAIMCSCCGPGFTDKHSGLRRLLLDKANSGIPFPLRLYTYIMCNSAGRSTGVAGIAQVSNIDFSTRSARVVAEFAWWPLGLLLAFDQVPISHATDVSHWLDYSHDDRVTIPISIPCRWVVTPYPLDCRSPDEVEKQAAENDQMAREFRR